MVYILIDGEEKKVACGPCIRGHRSSTCTHNERLLIEVRKPGRPLTSCPHPSGACGCERAVIYAIPRVPGTQGVPKHATVDPLAPISTGIKKQRTRKSSPKVKPKKPRKNGLSDGDEVDNYVKAQLAPLHANGVQLEASLAANSSSRVRARRDSSITQDPATVKDDERPHLTGESPGFPTPNSNNRWPSTPTPITPPLMESQTVHQCCPPQQANTYGPADGLGLVGHTTFNSLGGPPMDMGVTPADSFSLDDSFDGPLPPNVNLDFFSQWEGRHGCRTGQLSNHMDGSGEQPDCYCGDGCMCLGCLHHPKNSTTQQYARWHHEMAFRADVQANTAMAARGNNLQPANMPSIDTTSHPSYQMNPYHSGGLSNSTTASNLQLSQYQPSFQSSYAYSAAHGQMGLTMENGYGANAQQHYSFPDAMVPSVTAPNTGFQAQAELQITQQSAYPHRTDDNSVSKRRRTNSWSPAPESKTMGEIDSLEEHQTQPHPNSSPENSQISAVGLCPAATPASPNSVKDDAVSPTGYQLQQIPAYRCDNILGTCLCDEGCLCTGCFRHSGHESENRVANGTSADIIQHTVQGVTNNTAPDTLQSATQGVYVPWNTDVLESHRVSAHARSVYANN